MVSIPLLAALLALCMSFSLAPQAAQAEGVQDDEYEDVERAHIVVYKQVIDTAQKGLTFPLVVQNSNVTISITLHNVGAG